MSECVCEAMDEGREGRGSDRKRRGEETYVLCISEISQPTVEAASKDENGKTCTVLAGSIGEKLYWLTGCLL